MLTTAPINLDRKPRDVQIAEIAPQTRVLRSRTWDRLKFEVEYARQKGTTANSYLIQADRVALLDPPGESFTQVYLESLEQHVALDAIDYIILSHVNSNRLATLKQLVARAPRVRLICSKPAANLLKDALPDWDAQIDVVRADETLDLGQGHQLQFITVPTPLWADGLCVYDPATRLLFTDKLFGAHVCGDEIFDEQWKALDTDRRHYFDCIHAAQVKQVETALDKLESLPASCYAPGHGPLIRHSLSRLRYDYRQWCQQQQTKEFKVVLLYASAYGNTTMMAIAIAQGLVESGVSVQSINCETASPREITEAIESCDGFIIGSPTLGGHAPTQIQSALGIVLATATNHKLAGVFGSYGWSGEAVDLLESRLRDASYRFGFPTLRVQFKPSTFMLETCKDAGAEFAQALRRHRRLRAPRQGNVEVKAGRTEQALARIVGSLCVLSYQQEGRPYGFLTSWISQATFQPPGLMVAIASDPTTDNQFQTGQGFVLNILKEGRNLRRHFSSQVMPGEDPFTRLATRPATNGCLILEDALAYVECTVQNRMLCGDRWLIYAVVTNGEVLEPAGITAVNHWNRNGRG